MPSARPSERPAKASVIVSKQSVDPGECQRSGSNNGACGNRAPKDVSAGKLPDRENRRQNRDHEAGYGGPE
jgi:hypothetical protein